MENLALNTIFYIMLFIFPGLLFRKFYFGGEFTKQFQQGNLMERFLWTLFFSVVILLFSSLGFIFLENHKYFHLQNYISYETIKKLFESLSNNKLPEKEDINISIYLNFLYLILVIYLISIVFGYISYKAVRIFNIDTYLSSFKFKNYWHYLIKSNITNGKKLKNNKYLYTNADIMLEVNGKTELYSGYVQNYYIDSVTNKLDCIVLKNAYKFIVVENEKNLDIEESINRQENIYEVHKTYKDKKIYKKNIPGDIFTISNEKIINLNLTYVEKVITNNDRKRKLKLLINSIYFAFFLIISIFPWIIKHDLIITFKRKIIISMVLINIIILLKGYLFEVLNLKEKREGFLIFITGLIFFSIPFLWFFKLLNGWITFGVMIFYLIFITIIIEKINPKK